MKKGTKKLIMVLAIILLAAFFIVPFVFANVDKNSVYTDRNIIAPIFYAVMLFASAAILVFYVVRKKKKYLWAILLFVSVIVVNTGYLALSLASNVSEALLANRISYFGNIYMLLFLLLTIINACKINYNKFIVIVMFSVSSIMFLFSATQGYLDIFYKNVDFAIVDGFSRIIKDYGPMHTVYMVYVFIFIVGMAGILIYAVKRKKIQPIKYATAIAVIGVINIAIWFVEQFINNRLEYLALSYVVNMVILMWICDRLIQSKTVSSIEIKMTIGSEDAPDKTLNIVVEDSADNKYLISKGKDEVDFSSLSDESILGIVNHINNSDKLTDREKEVAVLLIRDMKRKEMASTLYVSEDTIKTHTSHIFGKLEVSNRKELHELAEKYVQKDEK